MASDFAIHAIARAQNLSEQMVDGLNTMRPHLESILSDERELKRFILSALEDHPVATLFMQQRQAGGAKPTQILGNFVEQFISEHKEILWAVVKQHLDGMDDFVAKAHRSTLESRLEDSSGSRFTQLSSLSWHIVDSGMKFILSDSVIFAELDDGSFKPVTEPNDALKAVWLPSSSTRILVGCPPGKQIEVDAQRINEGAAACSFSAFCAEEGPNQCCLT